MSQEIHIHVPAGANVHIHIEPEQVKDEKSSNWVLPDPPPSIPLVSPDGTTTVPTKPPRVWIYERKPGGSVPCIP